MSNVLTHLFEPMAIRNHQFKNRIFSTGHMTVMLEDGSPSDRMVAYHEARAAGGAALIIIEAARVHPTGVSARPSILAYREDCINGYHRIAEACHAHGCKVFGQLSHPGREMAEAADGSFSVAYAPSAIPNERFHTMPRELSLKLIEEIITGFRVSADRLRRAGLDGIEIVASQGYLIAQFLNPRINQRTDKYGGDFENRLTFVREILDVVREGAGDEMVIGMRISGDEIDHDGLESDEVLAIATLLSEDGILDYINVTAGTSAGLAGSTHIVPSMAFDNAYVAPLAEGIRKKISIPVFVAGRINQPQLAEQVLSSGQADMCGMTRAMICDPLMPQKAEAARLDDIRACIACNQACIEHMLKGYPISCIQHPETGRELEFGKLKEVDYPRKIVIVGGGPGGMKAAAVASQRGHDVTLYEASHHLGGQANLAQLLPGRTEFGGLITNMKREMALAGVRVVLNTKVDFAVIERIAPDAVIVATGATPYCPPIEGADEAHIVEAWQILQGEANVGSNVVIADWRSDWIGLGLAEKLVRDGCAVKLAVNGITAGQMIPQYARDKWLGDLHRLGVEIIPYARLYGADSDTVYLQNTTSGEAMICEGVDTLVTSLGHQSVTDMETELMEWSGEVHVIGDCLAPRTAEEAVLEGLRAGAIV
jgi:2,4-dienoyl-CoA reductase-like NADH-dependent reductase (Old Yellow Enzyme family)